MAGLLSALLRTFFLIKLKSMSSELCLSWFNWFWFSFEQRI